MDERQIRAAFIAGATDAVGASTPQYKTLNDAAVLHDGLAPGGTEIWYMRGDTNASRDLGMGSDWLLKQGIDAPNPKTLESTHVLIGKIRETDPRKIYEMMQGENWSPQGEARQLIKKSGAYHTSIMVGDVIKIGNKAVMVDRPTGFYKLEAKKEVTASGNIETWIQKAAAHIEKITKDSDPRKSFMQKTLGFTKGKKFYRVYIESKDRGAKDRSAYCFIDMDGNIYKADGWSRPAKGVRGHVDKTNPNSVDPYTSWLYRR